MYAAPIEELIKAFQMLPSVGRRTAERYVFFLLRKGKTRVSRLSAALSSLHKDARSCEQCWVFAAHSPCSTCADSRRDATTICVVVHPQEQPVIEQMGIFTGHYHVLREHTNAELDPDSGAIKVKELIARAISPDIKEVILAINPTVEGESTMLYVERKLREQAPHVTVSRLARGLPMGSDIQYIDAITLDSAITHRQKTGPQ